MRNFLKLAIIVIIFDACTSSSAKIPGTDFKYDKTSIGTLKELYRTNLDIPYNHYAHSVFLKKHKEEVLKTLEVVEEVEVVKDVSLIFYRYSIGTETAKKTMYMRKMEGLYYPYAKYYSSYGDDPFENGKGEEAKKILTKATDWENTDKIWWAD